jgi:sugar lactone lactonase YvrE
MFFKSPDSNDFSFLYNSNTTDFNTLTKSAGDTLLKKRRLKKKNMLLKIRMNKMLEKQIKIVALIFLLPLTHPPVVAQLQSGTGMKVTYTVNENDLVPEGLAYDPVKKAFYVSSTYKRKIIKVNAKGKASDFIKEQQDGVHAMVGMRVDSRRRVLWAASGDVGLGMPIKNTDSLEWGFSGLYKYHLKTGKLIEKYLLHKQGEKFFMNDLVLDSNGTPYITDTRAQKIYTITPNNKLEVLLNLPSGHFPNGIDITPDGKYLFVAMYASPKAVYGKIEIQSKKLDIIEINDNWPTGADGLYYYQKSLVAILPSPEGDKIVQYQLNDDLLKIVEMNVIVENNPLLSQPSTGVVVGNKLYFIATSNLQLFAKLFRETNGKVNLSDLPPVRISEVVLK